ncbi:MULTISPECIES: response regulator [Chryseobacterium]|uniref:DNA-binding response regulator n=1 Tax=Chryseobacterium cucumeris TaxID=1813611 RepID=A0ABX9XAN9_9FLAO|nr:MULTISPECIES: response regulator transcription factor [Chryseobacterium]KYH03788.1 DNA-binding response regulator [Chryseobacterium cucumeris]MDH5034477.1 response regulator transcription factor [Chryseobacterium cucumeris]QWT87872.1 response regulator transcription factor [Chryseobacterium sp. PCH239]RKE77111.1 LuxR family two component transcriptional regulator [Chryseobacterium sp. AG363]ROH95339.1 DNA-binding response regulator [Chryseobacterium cucumeris]
MENEKINIVIVDDHPIVIEGLRMMLRSQPFFNVAGSFASGAETLSFIRSEMVDIVLLDITLPDSNGTELCREIKKISPSTSVIMFSNRSERSIIMQSIQNGASGYLLKNTSIDDLVIGIRGALSGDIVFCNETKQIISLPSQTTLPIPRLTKREKQILQMVAQGKTSNVIAEELFLSPLTVDTHRKNLLQKFQAKNSTELINLAVQQRMIEE